MKLHCTCFWCNF